MKAAIFTFIIVMIFTCWVQDSGQKGPVNVQIGTPIKSATVGADKKDFAIGELQIKDGSEQGTSIVTQVAPSAPQTTARLPYWSNE
jgi:hypothetical protein